MRLNCMSRRRTKKEAEIKVYQELVGSPYFPVFYGAGERYVAISHESGFTLYDCLLYGMPVPRQVIDDVEAKTLLVQRRA